MMAKQLNILPVHPLSFEAVTTLSRRKYFLKQLVVIPCVILLGLGEGTGLMGVFPGALCPLITVVTVYDK